MTINNRILQILELNKNVTLIEVNKETAREITTEVLDMLEKNNVELQITDNAISLQCYMFKTDCFAYHNKQCSALTDIDCVDCKFYKNKKEISMWEIEESIRKYAKNHK